MAHSVQAVELHVGPQGRVVIPAEIRRQLNIEPGSTLLAHIDDDRLVLEKRAQVMKRIRARFAAVIGQPSMADSLILERRAEALRELEP